MRKRLQNENLITFLGDFVNYYNLFINKVGKKGVHSHVLMFHDITPEITEAQLHKETDDDYSVCFERFREIIQWHVDKGYQFISLDELVSGTISDHQCVITFDDGLESVYTLAYPLLKEKHIPFTIYVITGETGNSGYLSAEQLRELSSDPLCTIGSHTVGHVMTRFKTDNELKLELLKSRYDLEKITSRKIVHFAYPYGSFFAHSRADEPFVVSAGYRTAAITYQDDVKPHCLPYRIPRYDASRNDLLKVL